MPPHIETHASHPLLVGMLIAFLWATAPHSLAGEDNERHNREQIGESLAKAVYRDEIRTEENVPLSDELHRLFLSAAIDEYRHKHKKEITPTPFEISAAKKYYDERHRERMKEQRPVLLARLGTIEAKLGHAELTEEEKKILQNEKVSVQSQLRPPGDFFAVWTMKQWKFQHHLYKKYGGGRLLWQQAGVEAFDATRKWLEHLEATGSFKITDPKLRSAFYEYWTRGHGHWMIDDPERIQKFVEPEILRESAEND